MKIYTAQFSQSNTNSSCLRGGGGGRPRGGTVVNNVRQPGIYYLLHTDSTIERSLLPAY